MAYQQTEKVILELAHLHLTNPVARRFFEWLRMRARPRRLITVERVCQVLDIGRSDAIALCRQLHEAGCGRFTAGRRGARSRFMWFFDCVSVGKVAAGDSDDLELIDDEVEDDLPDYDERATAGLTIPEAKLALSKSLGVPADRIEIHIRA